MPVVSEIVDVVKGRKERLKNEAEIAGTKLKPDDYSSEDEAPGLRNQNLKQSAETECWKV